VAAMMDRAYLIYARVGGEWQLVNTHGFLTESEEASLRVGARTLTWR
jgi:hypothetical protein